MNVPDGVKDLWAWTQDDALTGHGSRGEVAKIIRDLCFALDTITASHATIRVLQKRLADAEKELARYKGAFHGNWTPCRCSCHAPNDPLRLRLQWPCCSVRDASQ